MLPAPILLNGRMILETKSQGRTVRKAKALDLGAAPLRMTDVPPARSKPVTSVQDEIAGQGWYYRNHHVPALKSVFPNHPRMWTVERYYPTALGGPLYIETVNLDSEIKAAEEKKAALAKFGMRCVVVYPHMTAIEAQAQLEGVTA